MYPAVELNEIAARKAELRAAADRMRQDLRRDTAFVRRVVNIAGLGVRLARFWSGH